MARKIGFPGQLFSGFTQTLQRLHSGVRRWLFFSLPSSCLACRFRGDGGWRGRLANLLSTDGFSRSNSSAPRRNSGQGCAAALWPSAHSSAPNTSTACQSALSAFHFLVCRFGFLIPAHYYLYATI